MDQIISKSTRYIITLITINEWLILQKDMEEQMEILEPLKIYLRQKYKEELKKENLKQYEEIKRALNKN